jgi:hypothetical protein
MTQTEYEAKLIKITQSNLTDRQKIGLATEAKKAVRN